MLEQCILKSKQPLFHSPKIWTEIVKTATKILVTVLMV